MAKLQLSQEQVVQLEQFLWDAYLAAEGEQREQLYSLYTAVVTKKQAVRSMPVPTAQCATCGQVFMPGARRRYARYCSQLCRTKAYQQRYRQRSQDDLPE